jgi:hypothetical protein
MLTRSRVVQHLHMVKCRKSCSRRFDRTLDKAPCRSDDVLNAGVALPPSIYGIFARNQLKFDVSTDGFCMTIGSISSRILAPAFSKHGICRMRFVLMFKLDLHV